MREADSSANFKNIQALRAVAALLVLAFHVYAVEGKYFGRHVVPAVLGTFGTCGVDLFFVISGFAMTTSTRGQFRSRNAAVFFLGRRAMRIYPMYWLYSLMVLAVMSVLPQWSNASTGRYPDVLRSLLLLPGGTLPLLLQGWSLIYEMFFYVVFAVLLACIAERFFTIALAGWALVTCALAYLLASARVAGPSLQIVGDPLVLEFIAGCLSALIWPAMRGFRSFLLPAIGVSMLVGSVAIGQRLGFDEILRWRAFYFGVPAFFVVLGAASLEVHEKMVVARLPSILGDASYSLYLSHVLVISAVGHIYSRFASARSSAELGTLLCIAVAILVGYLSYRVVEKPLNRQLRRRTRAAAIA